MTHKITLQNVVTLTPDVRNYVFSKPGDYTFTPGQATDLALDRDGWRDEKRPFSFTSDPGADVLAFTIKSFPDHDGVTDRLRALAPGDSVLIEDAWGAIEDKGPGVFIAGGAGITPFIGILQHRARRDGLKGCALLYANSTARDIILRDYWENLDDLRTEFVVTEASDDLPARRLDGDVLDATISNWNQTFYVCGPPDMEDDIVKLLKNRGVPDDRIVRED